MPAATTLVDLGMHAVPIDLSTTYPARDSRREAARLDMFAAGALEPGPPIYGRVGNLTVARFERALAELEACPVHRSAGRRRTRCTASYATTPAWWWWRRRPTRRWPRWTCVRWRTHVGILHCLSTTVSQRRYCSARSNTAPASCCTARRSSSADMGT